MSKKYLRVNRNSPLNKCCWCGKPIKPLKVVSACWACTTDPTITSSNHGINLSDQ